MNDVNQKYCVALLIKLLLHTFRNGDEFGRIIECESRDTARLLERGKIGADKAKLVLPLERRRDGDGSCLILSARVGSKRSMLGK